MLAIKAQFDGEKVVFPQPVKVPPGDVIVVFEISDEEGNDRGDWLKAQESAFARIWDNPEDTVYDTL